jgi:hypothetical protein
MSPWLAFATPAPSDAVTTLQMVETLGRPTLMTIPLNDRGDGECAAGWQMGFPRRGRG